MITLYYVKGISRLDEPLFDTAAHQQAFFHKYAIAELDTGFYPPHFQNQITISAEDASFNTSCNYLSLTYGTKNYYYFIDAIAYVSEDVVSLVVSLDSIQTYMFDCKFMQAMINKASIKRWDDPDAFIINRGYIRENLSGGNFQNMEYGLSKDRVGWYVIWVRNTATLYIPKGESYELLSIIPYMPLSNNDDKVAKYAMPLCIPVPYNKSLAGVVMNGHEVNEDFTSLCSDASVLKIEWFAQDIFSGLYTTSYDNNLLYMTMSKDADVRVLYVGTEDSAKKVVGAVYTPSSTSLKVPYNNMNIQYLDKFRPNRSKKVARAVSYVPALIDENYINIGFGEQMARTSYPLHKLTKPFLYGISLCNWIAGTRCYYLSSDEYKGSVTDPYQTMLLQNTDESIDLYTNAWNEYYSRNKGTWTIGYALNKQQNEYGFYINALQSFGNALSSAYSMNAYNQSSSAYWGGSRNEKHNRKVSIEYQNSANQTRGAVGAIGHVVGGAIDLANYFENNYVLDQERAITKENLMFTPDVEKHGNNVASDRINNSLLRVLKIDEVTDMIKVMDSYELYGYSVAWHTLDDNLFDVFNNRYYFNVIQADIGSMSLEGVFGDESTISAIKSRFSAGLRLWNTDNGTLRARYLGDFQYDNVETAFIKE